MARIRKSLTVLRWLRLTSQGAVLLSLLPACSLNNGQPALVKGCQLPQDQTGTLSGHWQTTPVPIAFHQGDFSAGEMASITAGADTWNQFFSQTAGMMPIDYGGNGAAPRTSAVPKPGSLCSQEILNNGQFSGQVVIYKDGSWPYPNLPNAIALTSFCPMSASPLPNFYMAIMELNYQSFFTSGNKLPDLQSIATHEFGHLVGLNHSCETASKTGTPNCTDPNLPTDYSAAVMFPIFNFDSTGTGQQKRGLAANDEGRANCLYMSGTN